MYVFWLVRDDQNCVWFKLFIFSFYLTPYMQHYHIKSIRWYLFIFKTVFTGETRIRIYYKVTVYRIILIILKYMNTSNRNQAFLMTSYCCVAPLVFSFFIILFLPKVHCIKKKSQISIVLTYLTDLSFQHISAVETN